MELRTRFDAVGELGLLLFGLILVAGALGTLAQHSGWWTVAAISELLCGAALLTPRRRARDL